MRRMPAALSALWGGVQYFFQALFQLLCPRTCRCCGRILAETEKHVCLMCLAELAPTNFQNMPDNPMKTRMEGRVPLCAAAGMFFFHHDGAIRNIIHEFKYRHNPEIAVYMGRLMGARLKESHFIDSFDYIVPVPLHPKKKRIRGYNQSEMLALGISQVTGVAMRCDMLIRTVFKDSQTTMGSEQRFENVQSNFAPGEHLRDAAGRSVLLVDDVFTTGATAEACIAVLRRNPGVRVGLATLAYVAR